MAFEIVDGMTGTKHISSDDLATLNDAIIGGGYYVWDYANTFWLTMSSANKAVIFPGVGMVDGKRFWNSGAVTLTVDSGTQGKKRNDIVVARYSRTSAGIESVDPVVIKGTPTTGAPTDPAVTTKDLKLWRIPIDGLNVGTPVRLFSPLPAISDLADANKVKSYSSQNSEEGTLVLDVSEDLSWFSLRGKMLWNSFSTAWSKMVHVPGLDNGSYWYIDTGLNIGLKPGKVLTFGSCGFSTAASSVSPLNFNLTSVVVDGSGKVYLGGWKENFGSVPFCVIVFGSRLVM